MAKAHLAARAGLAYQATCEKYAGAHSFDVNIRCSGGWRITGKVIAASAFGARAITTTYLSAFHPQWSGVGFIDVKESVA